MDIIRYERQRFQAKGFSGLALGLAIAAAYV